ncbi:IclR family transcriptional regulator [Falsirhodobacter xinxiangensis]|uniref:IclR family transcriptional regulator n=1 Tax=Falsirhodobacter xinxiangensis TaxID=2530049 RepID=UPI001C7072EE|nr:IclR family transcriptional regulator [Rhodobacter xinxiangensis]
MRTLGRDLKTVSIHTVLKAIHDMPHDQEESGESKQTQYNAPALEKGLDILELLAQGHHGLTRKEIAERLGRSVGEVFRMVETLTRRAYIVQRDDSYVLGMKLFELAHEFPPLQRLLRLAIPRMEVLAATSGQSCHLSVRNGNKQLVVAQVDTPTGVGFGVKIGSALDMHQSASGRVLLAFDEREVADRVLSADVSLNSAERSAVLDDLTKIAEIGFAFMKSRQFSGVEAMSFPIFDARRHALAALTVPYVTRLDDQTKMASSDVLSQLSLIASELNTHLLGNGAGPA